jgi:pyridinium-3,5-biscarboxylic acid mononucleotide synthase
MTDATIRAILAAVARGETPSDDAAARLIAAFRASPFEDLGFARVDHHRAVRQGQPEVVFGLGKTTSQVVEIARRIAGRGHALLVTRATPDMGAAVSAELTDARFDAVSRTIVRPADPDAGHAAPGGDTTAKVGPVLICCAGTADLPVAEEAAACADAFGLAVERLFDVGVAGIHRLLEARNRLETARVLIVVAGMEGALPSVVGGLTAAPVIAVPTSVGYGASFDGLAALLAMLNSCASGIAVMNIDNGFGAAALAARILRA